MCREELHWKLCGQNSSSRTLLHSSSVHAVNQPLFDSRYRLQRDRQSKRSPGRLNIPTYFLTYLLRRSSSGSPPPETLGELSPPAGTIYCSRLCIFPVQSYLFLIFVHSVLLCLLWSASSLRSTSGWKADVTCLLTYRGP